MFGERLKLARKKAGFSLRSLSEALDKEISAQAIGKYERGEMMPGSGVLLRMSKILDVSLEFLMSEQVQELGEVEFRKLSGTSAKDRARVEAEVINSLQRYLAVEEILDLDSSRWEAPEIQAESIKHLNQVEGLAIKTRKAWELGIDPIPNMTSLLEDHGIKVLVLSLPNRVSGLTTSVSRPNHETNVPVIVVNKDMSLERRRLTLAHELGHKLIHEESDFDHEKAANVFAGAFLVPKDHLVNEIGKERNALGYQELIHLKRMYRVSGAALLVRLKQLGVISESSMTYAFQTFAKKWRSKEPIPLEHEGEEGQHEVPRRFERLCYWALAEQLISTAKAIELLQQSPSEIEKGLKGPAEGHADSC